MRIVTKKTVEKFLEIAQSRQEPSGRFTYGNTIIIAEVWLRCAGYSYRGGAKSYRRLSGSWRANQKRRGIGLFESKTAERYFEGRGNMIFCAAADPGGSRVLLPVIEELARQGAIAEGLPESCLKVTGHPSLTALAAYVCQRQNRSPLAARKELGLPGDKLLLAFVNEPLRRVLGSDLTAPGHYGFTEDQVLSLWIENFYFGLIRLSPLFCRIPRTIRAELAEWWRKNCRGLSGRVLRVPEGRTILPLADALAGMASILVYDAWICDLPTLSMQPGEEPDFAGSDFYALEKMDNARSIIGELACRRGLAPRIGLCDVFIDPISDQKLPEGAVFICSGVICLRSKPIAEIVAAIKALRPKVVVHFEPFPSFLDLNTLYGQLCCFYLL